MRYWDWNAFVGGVLGANSIPHLMTAAKGERMLTPYGGNDSGPAANLAWGVTNVFASTAFMVYARRRATNWWQTVVPYATGWGAFWIWDVVYETYLSPAPTWPEHPAPVQSSRSV